MNTKRIAVACTALVGLSLLAGCSKSRARRSEATDDTPAPATSASAATGAASLLEKFPANDPVLGSKSYPLRTITTANLSGRVKSGDASTWPFSLVDARTRVEYENEHIPGAINVPAEQIEKRLASAVPDKSREIVFYCNGPACTKSHKAGRSAISAGFPHAVVYDEGMPAWKGANLPVAGNPLPQVELATITPQALRDALKTKSVQVVDVRPRDEFLVFRLAGSTNIELDDLESRLKNEVKSTSSAIVIADYTGHQQLVTVRLLARMGYTNVKGLEGGLRGWQGANLPVDKGLEEAAGGKVANAKEGAAAGAAKGAPKN